MYIPFKFACTGYINGSATHSAQLVWVQRECTRQAEQVEHCNRFLNMPHTHTHTHTYLIGVLLPQFGLEFLIKFRRQQASGFDHGLKSLLSTWTWTLGLAVATPKLPGHVLGAHTHTGTHIHTLLVSYKQVLLNLVACKKTLKSYKKQHTKTKPLPRISFVAVVAK